MSSQHQAAADQNTSFDTSDNPKIHQRLTNLIGLYKLRFTGFLVFSAYLFVAFLLYLGWQNRLEQPLTAESGTGYALGIIGGSLMLLLLLYPLRKHARFMRRLGPVRYWFRTHMLFGILGPVCILFHCGFSLGSLNSNVALFCMILIASSGLVGRYFYTRIHHGLYGNKASLEELKNHSDQLKTTLSNDLHLAPWVLSTIESFEHNVNSRSQNLISSLWNCVSLGLRTWSLYFFFKVITLFKPLSDTLDGSSPPLSNQVISRHIGAHLSSIRKVSEFHFYERLFSIWHLLHLPLFVMLVISGIIHVVAVHMY